MSDLKAVREALELGNAAINYEAGYRVMDAGLAALSRLEAEQSPAAPPVEPCPKAKALDDLLALVGETVAECEVVGCSCANATTFGAARKAAASPCSPCPRCGELEDELREQTAAVNLACDQRDAAFAERDRLQATVKALGTFVRWVAKYGSCHTGKNLMERASALVADHAQGSV